MCSVVSTLISASNSIRACARIFGIVALRVLLFPRVRVDLPALLSLSDITEGVRFLLRWETFYRAYVKTTARTTLENNDLIG